jgi:hypothetical protein
VRVCRHAYNFDRTGLGLSGNCWSKNGEMPSDGINRREIFQDEIFVDDGDSDAVFYVLVGELPPTQQRDSQHAEIILTDA